jgi:hypothetical protein
MPDRHQLPTEAKPGWSLPTACTFSHRDSLTSRRDEIAAAVAAYDQANTLAPLPRSAA